MMASLDDTCLLINHIRKCFVTGDDSGFCELLVDKNSDIGPNELSDILNERFVYPIIDTEEDCFSRFSPECPYVASTESAFFDGPSGTSADDVSQPLCDHFLQDVKPVRSLTEVEVDRYFPLANTTPPSSQSCVPKKSALTLALEQAKADGRLHRSNLFADYSIYDGREEEKHGSKPNGRKLTVWFWRISDFPRTSIRVQPRSGTTVQQLVGLCLWQYFNQIIPESCPGPFAHLERFDRSFVDRILVYMLDASDDDLDSDFPPLDPSDPIEKYQFDAFALVERSDSGLNESKNKEVSLVLVTIHLAQGVSIYRFPANAQLSAVLERAMVRRHLRQHGGYEYHLESWPPSDESCDSKVTTTRSGLIGPGQKLSLSLQLSDVVAAGLPLQFVLVRDNSRCLPMSDDYFDEEEVADSGGLERLHSALQLRQYRVSLLKGLFQREVQLNVSAEGIKIEYVVANRRAKLFPMNSRPVVFGVHALADCELISSSTPTSARSSASENKSAVQPRISTVDPVPEPTPSTSCLSGKVQFRVIHLANRDSQTGTLSPADADVPDTIQVNITQSIGSNKDESAVTFQHICFESQWARARTICDQINLVLECSGSKARRLYMQHRLAS